MYHLIAKIREVGIVNCIVGLIKREYYKRLAKRYEIDTWHTSPYELRSYAQCVAQYINSEIEKSGDEGFIVDLGCGLGEIIRHIKAKRRAGMDLSKNAIEVAKYLDKSKKIIFSVGSFSELIIEEPIQFLITLNFMHGGTEDKWVEHYAKVTNNNTIKNIIVDTLENGENVHRLDFTKILPDTYSLHKRMGPFLGGRFLEIYTLTNEKEII